MHIVVSYAKKDTRTLARQLRDALAALPNVTAWMDETIEVGTSWPQQIQEQIDRCDLMVVLLSPDVNRDPKLPAGPSFVMKELNYALYVVHKPVMPVMAQQTQLPLVLSDVQYVGLRPNSPDEVARVVEAVCQRTGITPPRTKPRAIDLLPPPFEWIEIPAGRVEIEDGREVFDVPAFIIAKYPITNRQYAKFIEAGGYRVEKWWTAAGWQAREKNSWTGPRYWRDNKWNRADYPVVGTSWYEAVAFCQWLSETTDEKVILPTEPQWQRAAQGDDSRAYPWGNEIPNEQLCNWNNNIGHTTPVTQYPMGVSPYGVLDMSGNVWEWCLTIYGSSSIHLDGTGARVLRGGSWSDDGTFSFRAAYHNTSGDLSVRTNDLGFRIARSR